MSTAKSIKIGADAHRKLQALSNQTGVSLQTLLENAVDALSSQIHQDKQLTIKLKGETGAGTPLPERRAALHAVRGSNRG